MQNIKLNLLTIECCLFFIMIFLGVIAFALMYFLIEYRDFVLALTEKL